MLANIPSCARVGCLNASRVVNKAEMYGQATFADFLICADIFHYIILFYSANVVITIFKSDETLRGLCAC